MKINILLISVFLTLIIYASVHELHGIVGLTRLDGSVGCVCHNIDPSDSVFVWIEGPDSVLANDTANYKIYITGGPAVTGGFNVAARFGFLDTTDFETRIIIGQLTHSSPKEFFNDTVYWNFKYSAPDSIVTDTIYSVANSVNGDSIPTPLDQWNFGENFSVWIYDNPVGQIKEIHQPEVFILEQNYPNPFNPITKIKFRVSSNVKSPIPKVTLKIYDLLGNEIATLVDEEKSSGFYEVVFDASELSSGIYYYRIQSHNFAQSKKMILMK